MSPQPLRPPSTRSRRPTRWLLAAALAGLLVAGCAGAPPRDPLEPVNRVTYRFNDTLDRYAISPVTNAYVKVTPQVVRTGISNFFDNLTYVNVILNDLLQGKGTQTLADFWRLVFNTTLGFGGFYDIATPMGLPPHDEDFGQTLGTWGVGAGAYLVLPVLGPSSLRDAPGLGTAALTNPLFYVSDPLYAYPPLGLEFIDMRSRVSKALKIREAAAIDPYAFTRAAYFQRRRYLIYDGHPPKQSVEEDENGETSR